jgi:long-chain acyl-CoA synthetase
VLPSSPRLFERMYAAVTAGFERESGVRRRLVDWALGVGRRASRSRLEGKRYPRRLALQVALADRLVFSKVKERLGGRLRHAISGGAALSPEVAEFFHALDILVLEGYGLTECSVVSVNRPSHYEFGTVGPPLPGVEVRLAEDGELLVRAENVFRGYHGKLEETAAVLSADGWLRTGDVAEIDDDGFIRITDRKKDIIVLAGGKNVAPQKVEAALTASPYVSQALVVGDDRPFVTALVAPDRERAAGAEEEVRALVERAVADANRALGRDEQVRRFAVLAREFTAEADEVTPTLKLRRRVCEEHFRDEIERLYRGGHGQ